MISTMRQSYPVLAVGLCAAVLGVSACRPAPEEAIEPQEVIDRALRLDLDGQHDEAVALYRKVLERTPESFDAHYGIARALDLSGRYDEARRHFARAIALASDGAKDQALRMMGVSRTFVRDATGAATYFRQVFDRRVAAGDVGGAAEVANELGRVYLELGNPARAYQWYRTGYEMAAREPDRPAALIELVELRWAHAQARIAVRRGDASEAQQQAAVVKALLDKGSNPDQRIHYPYLRGYINFHLQDYEGAIAELQQADQEDPFILLLLAQAFEHSGKTDRARDYYRRVLASSSHAVTNALARPVARQKLGQDD
ncbi:MAG: tetratricopeptide repeat protein [Luteitalea sp.]|nr:tetratricopeptide repeat protein [Luteitalea sp.]